MIRKFRWIIYLIEFAAAWAALRMTNVYFWYMYTEDMSLTTLFNRIIGRHVPAGIALAVFIIVFIFLADRFAVPQWVDRLYGAFSAVAICMGQCVEHLGTIFILHSAGIAIASLIRLIGWYVIGTYFMAWLRFLIGKICGARAEAFLGRFHIRSERAYWIISTLFIFVCWTPYLIARYPAGIEWDAYHQILQTLGYETFSAHWPPVSSLFMGGLVALGHTLFGSYNAGLFLLAVTQSVIISAVLGYVLLFLRRVGTPAGYRLIVTLLVAIAPIFPAYLTTVIKDSMYAAAVLLYTVLLAEVFMLYRTSLRHFVVLTLVGILMALFRNNGIYIVYAVCTALVVIAVKKRGDREKLRILGRSVLSTIIICLFYAVYLHALLPALDISQDREAEALSVPVQQTARYLIEYPDDVTEEERAAISAALNIDTLVKYYDPELSDRAKGAYRGDSDALPEYLITWAKLFFRHPSVYIDAFLDMNYGFLYPAAEEQIGVWVSLYYAPGDMSSGITLYDWPRSLRFAARRLYLYATLWRGNVLTYWLVNVGMYNFLTLWLAAAAACSKRHRRFFLYFIPGLIGLLVCLAGPTSVYNNGMRYALPLVISLPVLAGLMLSREN